MTRPVTNPSDPSLPVRNPLVGIALLVALAVAVTWARDPAQLSRRVIDGGPIAAPTTAGSATGSVVGSARTSGSSSVEAVQTFCAAFQDLAMADAQAMAGTALVRQLKRAARETGRLADAAGMCRQRRERGLRGW